MDAENLKSWASQPDVCRCCLSASGAWDLTASYITDGIKEVFSEMLHDCYGISLSRLTEWGPSHLVCQLCVGHLRDARSFKRQVLTAEACFTEHCCGIKDAAVKIETDPDSACPDDFTELPSSDDDNKNELQTSSSPELEIKHTKRKRQKSNSKLKKRVSIHSDYDSDTPLTKMSKKNEPSNLKFEVYDGDADDFDHIKDLTDNRTKVDNDKVEIPTKGPQPNLVPLVKQISERKRIILTCNVILRDTTACPFRHHKSWFQCFFCTEDFMEINTLRSHTLETHKDIDFELKKMKRYPRSLQIDISNLKCRQCNLVFLDIKSLKSHLISIHNKIIYNECIADYKVNSSPYFCHICNQEFHVFRTLTTHLNEHYANCICDVCGRSFINSKRLKVHKRTHENGNFPCNQCDKVLKTKTSKANHMESAHSNRVLKCQLCFKPMKHYNDRIKHMSEVHNITHKFKCPICSKEYNIKHYLATHIRQTHGNKNKKCLTCGMAFITNHGLKKHMLKHSGQKPFSCTLCSKAYARSYTLREHMRAHESDRRFLGPE